VQPCLSLDLRDLRGFIFSEDRGEEKEGECSSKNRSGIREQLPDHWVVKLARMQAVTEVRSEIHSQHHPRPSTELGSVT
jgi:rubredoxin